MHHVGRIQLIRLGFIDQARFKPLHNFITEVADQSTGKHWQFGHPRSLKVILQA